VKEALYRRLGLSNSGHIKVRPKVIIRLDAHRNENTDTKQNKNASTYIVVFYVLPALVLLRRSYNNNIPNKTQTNQTLVLVFVVFLSRPYYYYEGGLIIITLDDILRRHC
jgi:hypothetical protein